MKDFFISYNKSDKEKAKWIAGCLEQNGYSVIIQAWDFQIGNNFMIEMQKAVNESQRVIAVLSQSYLNSIFCQAEWAVTFAKDPTGEKRLLIPIRVEKINLPGFFSTSIYIDLFDIDEETAKKRILQAVDKNINPRKSPLFSSAFSTNAINSNKKSFFNEYEKYDIKNVDFNSLPPPLTQELQDYYFECLTQSDSKAKNCLIESNLRLVLHIAKHFYGKYNYSNNDLVSIGVQGLIKAISNFESKKKYTFSIICIKND